MNGKRYFLDTNAIVQLLSGNRDLLNILSDAVYVATSVICELEFLSFPGLSKDDQLLFQKFLARVDVVDLCSGDDLLKEKVLALRAEKKLKLPDAVIAASSAVHACILLTADSQLLKTTSLMVRGYQTS
jgi:tRNA(fMet)-specific endonuclease VapC